MLDDVSLPALSDLQAEIEAIEDVREEERRAHEVAKIRMAAVQEKIQDTLVTLNIQIGDNGEIRARTLQYLYWMQPDIEVTWLAEAFGLEAHQVSELAGRFTLSLKCSRCNADYDVSFKHRETMRSILHYYHKYAETHITMCKTCRQAIRQEQLTQSEAHDIELAAMQASRDARLQQLRRMPYQEYLQSPEWNRRRTEQLRRAGFRCQVCNEANVQLHVHHRTYERRGNEAFRDLIVLCSSCHSLFHSQGKLAR